MFLLEIMANLVACDSHVLNRREVTFSAAPLVSPPYVDILLSMGFGTCVMCCNLAALCFSN